MTFNNTIDPLFIKGKKHNMERYLPYKIGKKNTKTLGNENLNQDQKLPYMVLYIVCHLLGNILNYELQES